MVHQLGIPELVVLCFLFLPLLCSFSPLDGETDFPAFFSHKIKLKVKTLFTLKQRKLLAILSIATFVQTEGHAPSALDPNSAMEGRVGQIVTIYFILNSTKKIAFLNKNYGLCHAVLVDKPMPDQVNSVVVGWNRISQVQGVG